MKRKNTGYTALALGLMLMGYSSAMAVEPVGTAFSYQGRLTQQNQLVDEPADLHFTLWDAEVAGNQIAGAVNLDNWPIEDGLFTVELDFGPFAFLGEGRYLEIEVRTPAGQGQFVTLAPRQRLSPTPYAIGLSLPYRAEYSTPGNVFSIGNLGTGRALNVQISNANNGEAALNAVTTGSGPAGYFLNDGSGDAINARVAMGAGTAVLGESGGVGVHGIHTSRGAATPGVIGETGSSGPGAIGVLGRVTSSSAGGLSAGVRGINAGTRNLGIGVYGSQAASGWGVYGTTPSGRGVYGHSDSGTGVYGLHQDNAGASPGVYGLTQSIEPQSAGVSGRASATGTTQTYGVYGESMSILGVGVGGVGADGVRGLGNRYGVYGEGTDSSSIGVFALGYGGRNSEPALRADNFNGPAILANGAWAVRGEGTEAGVIGVTWEEDGVGGSFTNYEGGFALRATGQTELDGDVGVGTDSPDVRLHVVGGTDAELNGGGYLQLGGSSGRNVVADNNEIMARDGGAASTLYLNNEGGDVIIAPQGTARVRVLEITGADLAERFPASEHAAPGTVMEIDPENPGELRVSRGQYNRRVAGVVSGAGDIPVGAILGHLPGSDEDPVIALSGRVWVKCDASHHAIAIGDLLTTSATPGHAMTALASERSHGTVIGKAMTSLPVGEKGLVLVLVNLH